MSFARRLKSNPLSPCQHGERDNGLIDMAWKSIGLASTAKQFLRGLQSIEIFCSFSLTFNHACHYFLQGTHIAVLHPNLPIIPCLIQRPSLRPDSP